MTNVYSLIKLLKAFLIGAAIHFAVYMFVGRAEGGIFAIILTPLYSIYHTAKLFIFALIIGLFLKSEQLNRFWFRQWVPFITCLILGSIGFVYGSSAANTAYYDFDDTDLAQRYYFYLANPSFVIILFCFCFKPEETVNTIEDNSEVLDDGIDMVNSDLQKKTYQCMQGELIIEQKESAPTVDDTVYLNGELAPSGKYQIAENQFILVSNGNIYALRGS